MNRIEGYEKYCRFYIPIDKNRKRKLEDDESIIILNPNYKGIGRALIDNFVEWTASTENFYIQDDGFDPLFKSPLETKLGRSLYGR